MVFAKTIFPESFYGPMTQLHRKIFDLIQSDEKYVAIAAPRGIGKTTTCRTKAAKNILYQDSFFIPYVSKSHDSALLQTENLKRDLTSNEIIKKIFGPIKTKSLGDGDFSESFSKKSWVAYKSLVIPRGAQQQIRGLVYNNHRPDLFIIDDLEDDDQIENPEYRSRIKLWFHSVLMKAISRYNHDWRLIYIDTVKHEDSLLEELLASDRWCSERLELCDDDCRSTVPEIFSDEEIQEEYAYHEKEGMLDVFYREYRNIPISTKDAIFRKEYFKYYDPIDFQLSSKNLEFVVIVDPAKTVKLHADDSAIVGIGIDTASNALYIHDIVAGKLYPDQLYDEMFGMAERLKASVIAVEETSLNEFIKQPIKNEVVKRNIFVELIWLKARGGDKDIRGKDKRISSLAPYYRGGYIYHNPNVCGPLEAQLLPHPRAKRKDIADATAYVVELLDVGNRFFEPPETLFPDDESQYDDIEYDDPIENWRVA
jgi:hypothetical protein